VTRPVGRHRRTAPPLEHLRNGCNAAGTCRQHRGQSLRDSECRLARPSVVIGIDHGLFVGIRGVVMLSLVVVREFLAPAYRVEGMRRFERGIGVVLEQRDCCRQVRDQQR
jgi:hypothetical protein